jgi:hypothetical protein
MDTHGVSLTTMYIFTNFLMVLLSICSYMLIASMSKVEIDRLKAQLRTEFEMKDLGEAKQILGMEIQRDRRKGTFCLIQTQYLVFPGTIPLNPVFHSYTWCFSQMCSFSLSKLHLHSLHTLLLSHCSLCLHL